MSLTLITAPASEPINLDFAKAFLRIDHDHEDALILQMLLTARHQVENLTGKALIKQRVARSFDVKSSTCLRLSPGAVQQLYELRLVSSDGTAVIIDPEHYSLNTRCDPALITLATGLSWTQLSPDATHIEAEFSAGYGEEGADVPAPLRQAILLLTAQYYERGQTEDTLPVPMLVQALLMPYRGLRL